MNRRRDGLPDPNKPKTTKLDPEVQQRELNMAKLAAEIKGEASNESSGEGSLRER